MAVQQKTVDQIASELANKLENEFEDFDAELEKSIFADALDDNEEVEFTRSEIEQRIQEEGGFETIFEDYAAHGSTEATKRRGKEKVAIRHETYQPLLELRQHDRGMHVDRAHARKLRQYLMKLAKQRYLCDVVVYNGPNAHLGVAMHSLVLRAESDLWNYDVEKRAENRKPDEQIEIRLKNEVEGDCFKNILRYMYTGKIDVSISNVLDMQRAGTALQVPEVISLCNDFLQLLFSGQNLVTLMSALKMVPGGETSELMEVARQRITQKMDLSSNKRGGAFKENAVLNSGLSELQNLLEDPAMEAQSELDKLVMALNWLNFNRESRISDLKELLALIDFTKMTESELVSVWEIDEIFRHHPIAKELLMKANLARALSSADVDGQKPPKVDLEAGGSTEWMPNQASEAMSPKKVTI